jgi:hypothetical protein
MLKKTHKLFDEEGSWAFRLGIMDKFVLPLPPLILGPPSVETAIYLPVKRTLDEWETGIMTSIFASK